MADRSANGYLKVYGEAHISEWILDTSAAEHVYVGDPIIQDISEDTKYVKRFDSGITIATGDTFVGIAAEEQSVESGDAENVKVAVYEFPTILGFPAGSFTDADVGDEVYMSDSATLTTTSSTNLQIGKIHRVVDGFVFVQLDTPNMEA